jgi:hypothetical protein
VHRVADLVDAERLVLGELAGLVERIGLEEAPHARPGLQELAVARSLLLIGGEDGALGARLPVLDDLAGAPPQRRARLGGREPFDHEETVPLITINVSGAQHTVQCRWRG